MSVTRVAVVTGAAGAIGRAISQTLAASAHHVVMADVDGRGVEQAAAHLRRDHSASRVLAREVDLADGDASRQLATEVLEWSGRIDVLVNNAALQLRSGLATTDHEQWQRVFDVNVFAPLTLMGALAPHWQASPLGASVVNVVSRVWATGGPPIYVSSKAALVGLTRSAAFELGPYGVRCNAVAPSFMATAFTRGERSEEELDALERRQRDRSPLGRVATPQDVAYAVDFLGSDRASFITGEVLHVCGGTQLAQQG